MTASADDLKTAAAREALALVEEGMVLGLGSGTTSERFLQLLGERVAAGLRVTGVATSDRIAQLAREAAIPLVELDDVPYLDLAVDGADEIEPITLALIKGRGGALLREKLVESAARRLCIIADGSKLVRQLGERQPLPVAVIPFGWRQTADRIAGVGGRPTLRQRDGTPVLTDDGCYILDCGFDPIADPAVLSDALKRLVGVVEHGLFVGMTWRAIIADADGVRTLTARAAVR